MQSTSLPRGLDRPRVLGPKTHPLVHGRIREPMLLGRHYAHEVHEEGNLKDSLHGPKCPSDCPNTCGQSSAAICMNLSENPTKRTRHVDTRYWYGCTSIAEGHAALVKVDGKTQQPANPGTNNMRDRESQYYRYLFESPYLPN